MSKINFGAEDNNVSWCNGKNLQFLHPPGPLTGLVSFPVSGNTWLRYLIQKATGYITGSFYYSHLLYENGFPGEFIHNGSVIVIKTHLRSE